MGIRTRGKAKWPGRGKEGCQKAPHPALTFDLVELGLDIDQPFFKRMELLLCDRFVVLFHSIPPPPYPPLEPIWGYRTPTERLS
jgi:hypothetical protein